jgi:xylulokinase
VMGVTMGAGGAFRWIKETIADVEKETARLTGEDVYDILCREAARVKPGSDGLLFLPHLFGSRCPYDDVNSKGAFVGLTFQHQKPHLYRSVIEGVTFSFLDMAQVIGRMGVKPTVIRASGGGARSPLWRQILADIFNCEVASISGAAQGSAYGAALVAGIGVGMWADIDEAIKPLTFDDSQKPIPENVEAYRRLMPVYQGLYPALKDTVHQLWD